MPISQARMLALLSAAQDYQQALTEVGERALANTKFVADGMLSPADVVAGLPRQLKPENLLRSPIESAAAIAREASHFNRQTIQRNNRNARKRRQPPRDELVNEEIAEMLKGDDV